MIPILTVVEGVSPRKTLDEYLQNCTAGESHCFAIRFTLTPYWQSGEATPIPLLAVYSGVGASLHSFFISDRVQEVLALLSQMDKPGPEGLAQLSAAVGAPLLQLLAPMVLHTWSVPKPWGQEIWYTGVEERGVCGVGDGERAIPIPWLLAIHADDISGGAGTLVLLKILDPLPDPTFGDLYFEMHEQKQEVYVVTHVDKSAWPDGIGAIRFGFNQARVAAAASQDEFLQQYAAAVARYRQVRKQIDDLCDEQRLAAGIGKNEPVDATTLRTWLSQVPEELAQQELALREAMYEFTAMKPLRVGDVVSVPNFVPHSLQHGVRTVEFQTPVYERKILSFAQKVLTQDHWDTESALPLLHVDSPQPAAITVVAEFPGAVLEKIVDFDDFHAFRLHYTQDTEVEMQQPGDYSLVMSVGGETTVCGVRLQESQAAIIPSLINKLTVSAKAGGCLLLCAPKSAN